MKKITDLINIRGDLSIKMYRKSGHVDVYDHKNTVVTVGKQLLIKRLFSDSINDDLTIAGFSWAASRATIQFATQLINKFPKGMEITIIDQSNTEFNGQYTVLDSTLTSVTIETAVSTQPTTIGKISSLDNDTISDMRFGESQIAQGVSNTNLIQPLPNNSILDNVSASLQYLKTELDFSENASIYYLGFFDDYTGLPDGALSGSCTISEAALYNGQAANSGVMFCRQVFPPITKNYGDSMEILWRISVT